MGRYGPTKATDFATRSYAANLAPISVTVQAPPSRRRFRGWKAVLRAAKSLIPGSAFMSDINRVFERHGMAYDLTHGEVSRMAPSGLHEALAETLFKTGDAELDRLLETAREKFLNKGLVVRQEGLEKLWDAWERLKTVEPGKDKLAQVNAIIDKASPESNFRKQIDDEARVLTKIGNDFMIRHTETSRIPITESAHVDYLFHRMFSLIRLLLRSSGRGG